MATTWAMSLSLLAGCPSAPADNDAIHAHNARVRALVPGQTKTVAYLDLTNNGREPITLIRASSDHARAIEIHQNTTIHQNTGGDMVSMRRIESIVIPGQETVRLTPGGLHLMLFGVDQLAPSIEIRLLWSNDQVLSVPFRQVAIGAQ